VLYVGVLASFAVVLALGGSSAFGAQFHGVTPLKVCQANTGVGKPSLCGFKLTNSDSFGDTVTISSTQDPPAIQDVVTGAGGADPSGDLLSSPLIFSSSAANEPPVCVGGGGAGTLASPYVGATSCTLPGEHVVIFGQDFGAGASIETIQVSHHTATIGDYNLPGHLLTDQVTFHWRSVCESAQSCPSGVQSIQTGGSTNLVDGFVKITPPTDTNATGTNHVLTLSVTANNGTLEPGTHSISASIVGGPGGFVGTNSCDYTVVGNATTTASCTVTISSTVVGTTVVSATADIPIVGPTPGQTVTVTRSTSTVDNTNACTAGGAAPCDNASKKWVDAWIDISPANANNPVNTNHVLTITVHAVNGTLANGSATASIQGGPGSFVGSPTCNYTGGGASASCQVTITSAQTGTTVVQATSNISVDGQSITRTTSTAANTALCQAQAPASCNNANKNWAGSTARTDIHNAAHQVITAAVPGDVVHDKVFVERAAGTPAAVPNPTGTVTFNRYDTIDCSGPAGAQAGVALAADGTAESANFTVGQNSISYRAVYSGDSNYPSATGACEPLQVTPGGGGQITPTQVDCPLFASGTAPTLDGVNYTVAGGKIGQGINPGVFFFWTTIKTTTPNQSVTVTQSNNSANNSPLFKIHQGWIRLYQGDCSSWVDGTPNAANTGGSFTVPTPGTYIIGIKYDVKSLAGTTPPVPANIDFHFVTSLGGNTDATVHLIKK